MAKKKKLSVHAIEIISYAAEAKCIGILEDGKKVFVEQVVPGDIADIRITKVKKNYAEAKLAQLIQPSKDRIAPFCTHFGVCGGCKWQMLPYSKQLEYKQQQVIDQMQRIGHLNLPTIEPIEACQQNQYYRNKLEYTFSSKRYRSHEELQAAEGQDLTDEPALGFHAPGLFDKVVAIEHCFLQNEPSNKILNFLKHYSLSHQLDYYDFRNHSGYLRNVMIRVASTQEVLVNLVFHYEDKKVQTALLEALLEAVPEISCLCYTINPKWNDSIYDLDIQCVKGKGFIQEKLENFTFNISPKSFFQTNTHQAERLYQITREFADLKGHETLYDLYCGTGSIGIFCSAQIAKLIGIELVPQAIEDAKINAQQNGIQHSYFYAGDVGDICTDHFFETHGQPDVIICDPPRAGMSEKLIHQILKMAAPTLVYVSCNPATQARDLALLTNSYEITRMKPVDMFPHTHHIENVVQLKLKS